MARKITLYRATSGLNTKKDPSRLASNAGKELVELAAAVNIDISDSGRISRRKGFSKSRSEAWHSLYQAHGLTLGVTGDALSIIESDLSYTPLRNVTRDARMSYAAPGDGFVYYANGMETGRVSVAERVSQAWIAPMDYVGRTTDRAFFDPPVGSLLGYYRGRMYVVQGGVAFPSEPFDYNRFALGDSSLWLSIGRVLMFRPVEGGIWVGTETETIFLAGRGPGDFERLTKADYPPLQYSDLNLNGHMFFDKDTGTPIVDLASGTLSALWMSAEGLCFGGADGNFYNLTKRKLDLPNGRTGSTVLMPDKTGRQRRIIGLIDP